MQNIRDIITPPQEVDGMPTRDLIDIGHDQQVVLLNARDPNELIQSDPLVGLLDKRVLSLYEPPPDSPIRQPRLRKLELLPILLKKEGLCQSSESGIGLQQDKLRNIRMQLVPADREDVQLIAEEHRVEDAARGLTDLPAVEAAEVLHGDVLVVVMGDEIERLRRRLP